MLILYAFKIRMFLPTILELSVSAGGSVKVTINLTITGSPFKIIVSGAMISTFTKLEYSTAPSIIAVLIIFNRPSLVIPWLSSFSFQETATVNSAFSTISLPWLKLKSL